MWVSISLPFSPMSVACTIDSRVMLYYLCLQYLGWRKVGRVPSSPHKACSSLGMRFREGHVKVTMCKQMFVAEVYCVCVCYFPRLYLCAAEADGEACVSSVLCIKERCEVNLPSWTASDICNTGIQLLLNQLHISTSQIVFIPSDQRPWPGLLGPQKTEL